jgi:hypothetical protein
VVDARPGGEDVRMPEPTTVWMVRLDRGSVDDVRGELDLADDAVVFTDAKTGGELRIPFAEVGKARRVRGSPILMLTHKPEGRAQRIAFYFSQPPPLRPSDSGSLPSAGLEARPMGGFGAFRRTSKRRHMKTNIGYLTTANTGKREEIQEWAAEIGRRLASAGGKD